MRKCVLAVLLALVSTVTFAQVSWNVKGGLNLSSYMGKNSDNSEIKLGGRVGLGMEYAINEMVSLQPSLYYTTKGVKYSESASAFGLTANADLKCTQMYLEVPIDLQFRFKLADDMNLIMAAGPYIACGVGGKTKLSGDIAGYKGKKDWDTFGDDGLRRFDAGANLELGMEFDPVIVGVSSQLGFCNVVESGPKNMNIGFFVGYKF